MANRLKTLAALPAGEALKRVKGAASRRLSWFRQRRHDTVHATYAADIPGGGFSFRLHGVTEQIPRSLADCLEVACEHYLGHRFDLLGSGPVEARYGMEAAGFAGHRYPAGQAVKADPSGAWLAARVSDANLAESRRLWSLIDQGALAQPDYCPIDWQIDFRSGWRWDALTYHRDVAITPAPGADIKVPWELARLQHLPQMALAAALALRDGDRDKTTRLAREIRAQILDFIACNPPRFGIHWRTPMEAGIRVANILMALDILASAAIEMDEGFLAVVQRSTAEHARHILDHLEWSEDARSNHYLANILGLLFAAATLPRSPETDAWLAFSVREFVTEIDRQFHNDGGNYEASTNYHRLSGEMAFYGAALILGFGEDENRALKTYDHAVIQMRPPFAPAPVLLFENENGQRSPIPPALQERLQRMAEFTADVTKPDGQAVQIGDTDSGRLFKLHPAWLESGNNLIEDCLDHRSLLAAAAALTGRRDLTERAGDSCMDEVVVESLAKGRKIFGDGNFPSHKRTFGREEELHGLLVQIGTLPAKQKEISKFALDATHAANVICAAYPEFGLYIFKNQTFFLSLRCADTNQGGAWGHSHDDNLAMNLQIDGRDIITDPGSYVYTADPDARNLYRSIDSHFAPRPEAVTAVSLGPDLFVLEHQASARCLYFGPKGFAACLDGDGWDAVRIVEFTSLGLRISDASFSGPLRPITARQANHKVSSGYGKKTDRPLCNL